MNSALEEKLIEGLEALERGEPLEQVLARYSPEEDELRPMLETAVRLGQLPLQPYVAAQNRSRQAMLAEAGRLRQSPAAYPIFRQLRQWLLPVVALAVMAFLLFNLFQPAVPGDSPSFTPTPTITVQPTSITTPMATEANQEVRPAQPTATDTPYTTDTPEATAEPTHTPTPAPTVTIEPTNTPTIEPTVSPTDSPSPTSWATDDHGGDDDDSDDDDGDDESDNSGPGNNNNDDADDDNSGPGGN